MDDHSQKPRKLLTLDPDLCFEIDEALHEVEKRFAPAHPVLPSDPAAAELIMKKDVALAISLGTRYLCWIAMEMKINPWLTDQVESIVVKRVAHLIPKLIAYNEALAKTKRDA